MCLSEIENREEGERASFECGKKSCGAAVDFIEEKRFE